MQGCEGGHNIDPNNTQSPVDRSKTPPNASSRRSRNTSSTQSQVTGAGGTDKFVASNPNPQGVDPKNVQNDGTVGGLLGAARNLLAQIAQFNLSNVNPHAIARAAKWDTIVGMLQQVMALVESALTIATAEGSAEKNDAAMLRTTTATAFAQAKDNQSRATKNLESYLKEEKDTNQLSQGGG